MWYISALPWPCGTSLVWTGESRWLRVTYISALWELVYSCDTRNNTNITNICGKKKTTKLLGWPTYLKIRQPTWYPSISFISCFINCWECIFFYAHPVRWVIVWIIHGSMMVCVTVTGGTISSKHENRNSLHSLTNTSQTALPKSWQTQPNKRLLTHAIKHYAISCLLRCLESVVYLTYLRA